LSSAREPTPSDHEEETVAMTASRKVTLFHTPNSRSTGVLTLVEELGADYELHVLNFKKSEQLDPAYLAVNPMGKVPAVKHGDALVTEQVAIYLYLADLYPEAGLAPAIGDSLRGPYLRWIAFYGSCFEPALVDRALKREPGSRGMSPYGDYDTTIKAITDQLAAGPWLLGERFTAADVLWGTALTWMTGFKLVPLTPVIETYLDRFKARPAVARAKARDAAIVAARESVET
jgi:glutathione S-transferase